MAPSGAATSRSNHREMERWLMNPSVVASSRNAALASTHPNGYEECSSRMHARCEAGDGSPLSGVITARTRSERPSSGEPSVSAEATGAVLE